MGRWKGEVDGWVGGWLTYPSILPCFPCSRRRSLAYSMEGLKWRRSMFRRRRVALIVSGGGGWVGEWVEENEAVRMSYCGFGMGGWVRRKRGLE